MISSSAPKTNHNARIKNNADAYKSALPKTLFETISGVIRKTQKSLSLLQVATIVKELLLDIQIAHSKELIHLNLRPESVLVLRSDPLEFFNNLPLTDAHVANDVNKLLKMIEKELNKET